MSTAVTSLSLEEQRRYDRQLRLWGTEVQARLLSSCVLFIGEFTPLCGEVAKNLCLAGVGVKFTDAAPVIQASDEHNVLFKSSHGDQPRAAAAATACAELNPTATIQQLHWQHSIWPHVDDLANAVASATVVLGTGLTHEQRVCVRADTLQQ